MYPLTSTNHREELMITLYNYSSRLSIIIILDWHWANSGGVGVEPRRGLSWFHSNELMHLTHKLAWYKLQIRLLAALAAVDDEVLPLILTYPYFWFDWYWPTLIFDLIDIDLPLFLIWLILTYPYFWFDWYWPTLIFA